MAAAATVAAGNFAVFLKYRFAVSFHCLNVYVSLKSYLLIVISVHFKMILSLFGAFTLLFWRQRFRNTLKHFISNRQSLLPPSDPPSQCLRFNFLILALY